MSTAATQHTSDGRRTEYPAPTGFTDEAAWAVGISPPGGAIKPLANGVGFTVKGTSVHLAEPAPRGWVVTVRRSDRFASLSWDDLATPIIIAHRGSGNIAAPENTMAAFQWAAALGYPVEADLQYTSDGALVCLHDDTLDRTAGLTGGWRCNDLTLDQVRALDVAAKFQSQFFSPQRIPTFDEYMALGNRALLAPEAKKDGGLMGADLARRIARSGMQQVFLVQSFSAESLAAVRAIDPTIRIMRLAATAAEAPSAAEATAAGYWAVCVQRLELRTLGASYVSALRAVGVKVLCYTANRLAEAEEMLALGVDGYFSDDAAHIARAGTYLPPGTTTIRIPPRLTGSGWSFSSHNLDAFPHVVGGFATFYGHESSILTTSYRLTVAGVRTAATPATQTIETKLKVVVPPADADGSRYVALRFCWTSESDGAGVYGNTESSGYFFSQRMDGGVRMTRVTNGGSQTQIASAAWPVITAGEEIPIRVELTAGTIKVTRTDTLHTVTANDATHPRGGFVVLYGGALVPGIGDVKITY